VPIDLHLSNVPDRVAEEPAARVKHPPRVAGTEHTATRLPLLLARQLSLPECIPSILKPSYPKLASADARNDDQMIFCNPVIPGRSCGSSREELYHWSLSDEFFTFKRRI